MGRGGLPAVREQGGAGGAEGVGARCRHARRVYDWDGDVRELDGGDGRGGVEVGVGEESGSGDVGWELEVRVG